MKPSASAIRWRGRAVLTTGFLCVVVAHGEGQGPVASNPSAPRTARPANPSAHAALVEQCVREAEFDPPPAEALRNGLFEYPMSFNLY